MIVKRLRRFSDFLIISINNIKDKKIFSLINEYYLNLLMLINYIKI